MLRRIALLAEWVAAHPARVGLIVGAAALLGTWFIQLVLLGVIVPDWGDGHGLVPGQDVSGFNRVAMEQAALIAERGWSAWELRPEGWGVSGLLSAWYALSHPAPWAFAPIQALMYGISAGLIYALISHLLGRRPITLLALVPMLLPTAAFVYAQPHREAFVFFGFALAIYGWWSLARLIAEPMGRRWAVWLAAGPALVFGGVTASWAVRAFSAEIFQGLAVLMTGLLSFLAALAIWRSGLRALPGLAAPAMASGLLLAMTAFHAGGHFDGLPLAEGTDTTEELETTADDRADDRTRWHASAWLPDAMDDRLRRLASARDHFADGYDHGRTTVDADDRYRSVEDLLLHTPRALQLALLSPFPQHWLPHEDAAPVRNVYRVVAGLEMVLAYAVLPFLLYAVWVWRARPELWVLLVPAVSWVMVYAYTVPVVGALFRYRYGGYIIILIVAVAGLVRVLEDLRNRRALAS